MFNPNNQPTKLEQVAASTIQGLRLLAAEYSWDFDKAISEIEFLADAHEHPVTSDEVLASIRDREEADGARESMAELAGLDYSQASRGY